MRNETARSGDIRKDRLYKIFSEKGAVVRYAARKLFPLMERLGLHVTADHFYEIIPNTRDIAGSYDAGPRTCHGIDFRKEEAEAWLLRMIGEHGAGFYETAATAGYYEENTYFRGVDALALYCVLRDIKPRRVVEIGHGFSTRVSLAALNRNFAESGEKPSFLSVDPYARFVPTDANRIDFDVVGKPLQESIPLVTGSLQAGDMLFVDSTHVYKYGSDVEVYFDHLYPQLAAGVHVHVHDVFSPYHYPKAWMTEQRRFWNEQYFLENFLAFNSRFEVTLPLHMLMRQSEAVRQAARSVLDGGDNLLTGQSFYFKSR